MTIKECYETFGGNYEQVLARFRSEERIRKYIYKFLDDQSFPELKVTLENEQIEDAFRFSHTLKGVSENLGFDKLLNASQFLTEALRSGDRALANSLFSQVEDDYWLTIKAIQNYQEESK